MVSRKRARNASIVGGVLVGLITVGVLSLGILTENYFAIGVLIGGATGIIAFIGMDPK